MHTAPHARRTHEYVLDLMIVSGVLCLLAIAILARNRPAGVPAAGKTAPGVPSP